MCRPIILLLIICDGKECAQYYKAKDMTSVFACIEFRLCRYGESDWDVLIEQFQQPLLSFHWFLHYLIIRLIVHGLQLAGQQNHLLQSFVFASLADSVLGAQYNKILMNEAFKCHLTLPSELRVLHETSNKLWPTRHTRQCISGYLNWQKMGTYLTQTLLCMIQRNSTQILNEENP